MNTKPEVLRLADELCAPIPGYQVPTSLEEAAAAELRRLHAIELEYKTLRTLVASYEADNKRLHELNAQLTQVSVELLEALKLAYPHINPKAVDAARARTTPLAESYVNTIVRAAIARAEGTYKAEGGAA